MNYQKSYYELYRQSRGLSSQLWQHNGGKTPEIQKSKATLAFSRLPTQQTNRLFRFIPLAFVTQFGKDSMATATYSYYSDLPTSLCYPYTSFTKEGLEESGKVFSPSGNKWILATRISEQKASSHRLPIGSTLLVEVSPDLLDAISKSGSLAYFGRLVEQATRSISSPVLEKENKQRYEIWNQGYSEGPIESELVSGVSPSQKGRTSTKYFNREAMGLFWQGSHNVSPDIGGLWQDYRVARNKALQNT